MWTLVLMFWLERGSLYDKKEIRYLYVPNLSSQEECETLAKKWLKLDEFSAGQCRQIPQHAL